MTTPSLRTTFVALGEPNYRRYFIGQAVSLVGTWMQTVALGWLVLTLTGSGTALGLVTAAQFVPILLLAPYGGLLADRLDKRRLLIATQIGLGLVALSLAAITLAEVVAVWMLVILALTLGLLTAADNPTRQAFSQEMVGGQLLPNAVALNSVLVNAARAVGPALGAVLIATVGIGLCFAINAVSYVAVVVALATMERSRLRPAPSTPRRPGQVREGLRYVAGRRELAVPLAMLAIVGTLAYEFSVLLPLLAEGPLDGGVGAYGLLTSAMGVGAMVGGLVVAANVRTGLRPLSIAALGFGATILLVAVSPSLGWALAAMVAVGAASVAFLAMANSTLQLRSRPPMRGRVMALWTVAFLGSTPVGAPLIGALAQHAGPRLGLVVGAGACVIAAVVGLIAGRPTPHAAPPTPRGC